MSILGSLAAASQLVARPRFRSGPVQHRDSERRRHWCGSVDPGGGRGLQHAGRDDRGEMRVAISSALLAGAGYEFGCTPRRTSAGFALALRPSGIPIVAPGVANWRT